MKKINSILFLVLILLLAGCASSANHADVGTDAASADFESSSIQSPEPSEAESSPENTYPPRPSMSPLAENYYAEYLRPFGLSTLWRFEFNENGFPTEAGLMNHLYCILRPPADDPLQPFTEDQVLYQVKADILEETIQSVFPADVEEIRQSFGSDYFPDHGIYQVRAGFGGRAPIGVVNAWDETDKTLVLYTTWYGWVDEINDYVRPLWKSVTVMMPGDMENRKYISNSVELLG